MGININAVVLRVIFCKYCSHRTIFPYHRLIIIAILVNNAFKTAHQSAKNKEDICWRTDAGFHILMSWIKIHYFRGLL